MEDNRDRLMDYSNPVDRHASLVEGAGADLVALAHDLVELGLAGRDLACWGTLAEGAYSVGNQVEAEYARYRLVDSGY